MAILRFNRANVTTFLEYLAHLKYLILDDEDDERPGDYSTETKGTLRMFEKIKEELLERLKFMKNIFSFLSDSHDNFILLEKVNLEEIDEEELERMQVRQEEFSDLEQIQKIVEAVRQESLKQQRGNLTRRHFPTRRPSDFGSGKALLLENRKVPDFAAGVGRGKHAVGAFWRI